MTYRVEYQGSDLEVSTLDAAIEGAKQAIAADIGPVSGWTVEHDDTINDWFVQGVAGGTPVGPTAVVTGPEPVTAPEPVTYHHDRDGHRPDGYRPRHPAGAVDDGWLRTITFTGYTPAEAFGQATAWLAGRPSTVTVSDVGWHPADTVDEPFHLRIHYHGAAD